MIAQLVRVRGNRGELSAIPLSDVPGRFDSLGEVLAGERPLKVERVWRHKDRLIFKFAGVDSIAEAEKLVGADVALRGAERPPLSEGVYWQSDLVGCQVYDRRSGRLIGVVRGWQEYGGPALLEVCAPGGAGILIPFARSICVLIDVAARRLEVDPPEGLLDLNRE